MVFLLLVAAVVLLGFSLVKQLRKAQAAKDAGVYGDEPVTPGEPGSSPASPTRAPTRVRPAADARCGAQARTTRTRQSHAVRAGSPPCRGGRLPARPPPGDPAGADHLWS